MPISSIYLEVKKLSPATVNVYNSAIRFLYGAILHRHLNYYDIPRVRHVFTYPTMLTMQEVQLIIDSTDSLRNKTMLMTIYGGGLRVSEIVSLKTSDIYASSMRILIRQGKGRKMFLPNIGILINQDTRSITFFSTVLK